MSDEIRGINILASRQKTVLQETLRLLGAKARGDDEKVMAIQVWELVNSGRGGPRYRKTVVKAAPCRKGRYVSYPEPKVKKKAHCRRSRSKSRRRKRKTRPFRCGS